MRLLVVLLAATVCGFGQDKVLPLFTIEKNTNANVVHYDARIVRGHLDPKQPVVAYWIMAAEDGRRQELNLLERLKAYGFNLFPDGRPDSYKLFVVSNKKKEIHVSWDGAAVRAEALIAGHQAWLEKIRVMAHKSWMFSLPDYAEMIGVDIHTGEPCSEKVTPADR